MNGFLVALTAVAALGCGLVAGVFFAFSTFVMKALRDLPAVQGIAAMQAINVAAIPSPFFLTGLGTAVGCVALAVWGVVEWDEPFAPYLLCGGALYLVGAMAVTAAFNLPRNDSLATVDPAGPEAPGHWGRYLAEWTIWNHVRGCCTGRVGGANRGSPCRLSRGTTAGSLRLRESRSGPPTTSKWRD